MTVALLIIFSILSFTTVVLASREVISFSPLRMIWGIHGLSVLLILIALNSRGIWFDAKTYLGDLWTASEAIHKTAQGLRSNIDYFSPIGPAQEWFYGLTLLFHAPSVSSIILANCLVAIFSVLLSVVLLRRRANPLIIAIVGVIAVTTALSPRDIDAQIPDIQSSFLAPYNRWGWALLVPIAMRAALPFLTADLIGAALCGTAIALLVLLKATYGFAAIGIYLIAQPLQAEHWREGAVVAMALGLTLLVVDVATGGQVRAYVADLALTARMPSNSLRLDKLLLEMPSFVFFALGSMVLLLVGTRDDSERPLHPVLQNWRAAIIALAVGGSGLIVLMQNHYKTEATTLLLMPLIVAEWTGLLGPTASAPATIWRRNMEWIALLVLITLARPAIDAGFILAQKVQLFRKVPLAEFAGTEFHDLVIENTHFASADGKCTDSTCSDYLRMLRGRDLLRKYCLGQHGGIVLAANFSNPFPALMGWRSPHGSPVWLHEGRSFSEAVHVPSNKLFGDVDCLMEALNESNSRAFMQTYGSDVRQRYQLAGENEDWRNWVRK